MQNIIRTASTKPNLPPTGSAAGAQAGNLRNEPSSNQKMPSIFAVMKMFGDKLPQASGNLVLFEEIQNQLSSNTCRESERGELTRKSIEILQRLEGLASDPFKQIFSWQNSIRLAEGEWCVDFSDPNSAEKLSEFRFSYFEDPRAQECWRQIQFVFQDANKLQAMQMFDKMFMEQRTLTDNIKSFAELIKLAAPEYRDRFKVILSPSTGRPDSFKVVLVAGQFSIPPAMTYSGNAIFNAMQESNLQSWNITDKEVNKAVTVSASQVAALQQKCGNANAAAGTELRVMLHRIQAQSDREHRAASKLQAAFRGYRVRGTKESSQAMTSILRNSDGSPVTGRGGRKVYKMPEGWRELPAPVENSGFAGTSKRLTHRDGVPGGYVGLTLHDAVLTWSDQDRKAFHTFDKETLDLIVNERLNTLVPQVRVNREQLMSRDLGTDNLKNMAFTGSFRLSWQHCVPLFRDLDRFHELGRVHRDIKPENMVVVEGAVPVVHLLDLDSAGKVGQFQDGVEVSTKHYIHPDLRGGYYNTYVVDGRVLNIGKLLDQYSCFASLISISQRCVIGDSGKFSLHEVLSLLETLPCNPQRKQALFNFLYVSPLKHPLPENLSAYLNPAP